MTKLPFDIRPLLVDDTWHGMCCPIYGDCGGLTMAVGSLALDLMDSLRREGPMTTRALAEEVRRLLAVHGVG